MTPNDALEVYQWIGERWPRLGWKPSEVQALAADSKGLDDADIWDAVYRLHHQGRQYPPSVSEVIGLARDLARGNALARGPKQLPVPAGWAFTFEEWRQAHGFGSRDEAVEAYRAGDRRCTGTKECGVCREVADRRSA